MTYEPLVPSVSICLQHWSSDQEHSPANPADADPLALEIAHPVDVRPLFASGDCPPQRRLHVCSYETISRLLRCSAAFSQVCDEALGKSNSHVELLGLVRGLQALSEVAGAGRYRNEFCIEAEVLLCEGDRSGEVFCARTRSARSTRMPW